MSYRVLGWCFFSKNYILNDSLQKVADEKQIFRVTSELCSDTNPVIFLYFRWTGCIIGSIRCKMKMWDFLFKNY